MRVCMLTTAYSRYSGDGEANFLASFVEELAHQKIPVDVVTPDDPASQSISSPSLARIHRFTYFFSRKFHRLRSARGGIPVALKTSLFALFQFPFFLFFYFLTGLRYARHADIIHAHWALSGLIGVFIKKITGKPLILTLRGTETHWCLDNRLFRPFFFYTLKHADFVTANSVHHVDLVRQFISPEKTKAISNGVDRSLFRPRDKQTCRKKLNLPPTKKILLFVGWLIPRKGVRYLLESFSSLIKKHSDLLLVIVGDGLERRALERQAARLGISSSALFVGEKSFTEISLWMNASDIFVLPSLSEGRPNVVLEALASGLPVVATQVDGTGEVIHNGKTGILVPPASARDLTHALLTLLQPKTLMRYKKNSLHVPLFSWKDSASEYIHIYRRLLHS